MVMKLGVQLTMHTELAFKKLYLTFPKAIHITKKKWKDKIFSGYLFFNTREIFEMAMVDRYHRSVHSKISLKDLINNVLTMTI